MIYLIPRGERTYGRVIGEGTFADVPVTPFLVYAGKKFEFKARFQFPLGLDFGVSHVY